MREKYRKLYSTKKQLGELDHDSSVVNLQVITQCYGN